MLTPKLRHNESTTQRTVRRALIASTVALVLLMPGCIFGCDHPLSVMVYEDDNLPWGGSHGFEHEGKTGSVSPEPHEGLVRVFIREADVEPEFLQEFARAYWAQYDMEPVFKNTTYSQRCADVI